MFDENLELVEDVIPAYILKKKGYHFRYIDECRWLHKEPASFKNYLRRKFRGGIGMALLQKTGWRKTIVPIRYWFVLAVLFAAFVLILIVKPLFLFILVLLAAIGLLLVRLPDIKKVRPVTDEKLPFLIFEIYIEYLWWTTTFAGYLYGLTMSTEKINSYLKGR